ncbi:MAG: phosphoribosylaminoimidazolesuccinocarboxamide synthase [Acidobacteria bacterium]|nr:phosphoribosylaminoimidazolesuccinocarboxamide synthase [Acidobacteriota bacterium]MCY3964364.1 phosphoribosylaminoimidazolesuccinocarboxamide synthase [Acidobacteriota bacterium]
MNALEGLPAPRRGKVRDIYDLGDLLLLVASDRVSAYDFVLSPEIPDKGKVLNQLTNFWFDRLGDTIPNHLVEVDVGRYPADLRRYADRLEGRSVLVRKAEVVPYECVARGYLAGSAFKEYQETGRACGHDLPAGMRRAEELDQPIFTPATKAEEGHDENIDYDTLVDGVGAEMAATLRRITLELFSRGRELAAQRGIILADTKFEFGLVDGQLLLIDEVLTPDSSRYWDAAAWSPGTEPVSYDKQPVRDWVAGTGWDKASPPPELTPEVVRETRERYLDAFRRITGRDPLL